MGGGRGGGGQSDRPSPRERSGGRVWEGGVFHFST